MNDRQLIVNTPTSTVTQIQSESITNKDLYNTLNAVSGSWGYYKNTNMEVAYVGHVCIWRKLGSGTQTFPIPPNKESRYFATFVSETESKGILINQKLAQLTVNYPEGKLWQVTGTFIINTKE